MKRHEALHDGPSRASTSQNRKVRTQQACEGCASLHIRCDDEWPCTRCRLKGIDCRKASRISETEDIAHGLLSLAQAHSNYNVLPSFNATSLSVDLTDTTQLIPELDNPLQNVDNQSSRDISMLDALPETQQLGLSNADSGVFLRDFLQGVVGQDALGPSFGDHGWWAGTRTPRDIFEFGLNTDLELNEGDFDFLTQYSPGAPCNISPQDLLTSASNPQVEREVSLNSRTTQLRASWALHRKTSVWRYRPASMDSAVDNLKLPLADGNTQSIPLNRRVTSSILSNRTRDKILTMVISINPNKQSFPSFPSLSLLDKLLQCYLASSESREIIHLGTFDPNETRPELCAIMIAAGAMLTADASLKKLGLAIEETIRVWIARLVRSPSKVYNFARRLIIATDRRR